MPTTSKENQSSEIQYTNDASGMYHVTIPENIKMFADRQFFNLDNLATIEMGHVTHIGAHAFRGCSGLTTVRLNNVEQIGPGAFYGCTNLENVYINGKLTKLPENAFENCPGLKGVTVDAPIETIQKNAFKNCFNLYRVMFANETITSIEECAFANCQSLENLDQPNLTKIGKAAFANCFSLRFVAIRGLLEIESVGKMAFTSCHSLFTMSFGNKLTELAARLFEGCENLSSVNIEGSSLKTIGEKAFKDCTSFSGLMLPDSTETIKAGAFENCKSLKMLIVPDSVTEMAPDVFTGCSEKNLQSDYVSIPAHLSLDTEQNPINDFVKKRSN